MLARRLSPTPSLRRAYSFFSSKPGGGRYFNPNKPPKVPTAAVAKPTGTTTAQPQPNPGPTIPSETETSQPSPQGVSADAASLAKLRMDPEPAVPSPPQSLSFMTNAPLPHFHPHPNLPTLHLHSFFALGRPLLLLSQPTNALFEPSQQASASQQQPAISPGHFSAFGLGEESGMTMEDPEADVNAARLLARSLVMQRVGSTMDWSEVMGKLGLEDEMRIGMDSVKRKRKKKMTKHRYKKRRKLQRAERRRLGK